MEDKQLKLLKEQRIKRFRQLAGLNEDIEPNTIDDIPKLDDYDIIAEQLRQIHNSIKPMMDDHMTSIVRASVKLLAEKVMKMGAQKRHMGEGEVVASSFYQGMQPKQAIEKAKMDYNSAIKKGNEGQADKIVGNLKSFLDAHGYNWKQDPYAMEILSDYI